MQDAARLLISRLHVAVNGKTQLHDPAISRRKRKKIDMDYFPPYYTRAGIEQNTLNSQDGRDSAADNERVTPTVLQLIEGYCNETGAGNSWMACGSVTLVKQASLNVLVDCGSPWDGHRLLEELKKHDVRPQNIQYVVCTHGHIDHIGNLNLFPESQILLDTDFGTKPGFYGSHNYSANRSFPISEHIDVVLTPGHTHRDLSVIVRHVEDKGTVVIAGDLFESEADLANDALWQPNSYDPKMQAQSRRHILEIADWIVPGHGPMFQVPGEEKSYSSSSRST